VSKAKLYSTSPKSLVVQQRNFCAVNYITYIVYFKMGYVSGNECLAAVASVASCLIIILAIATSQATTSPVNSHQSSHAPSTSSNQAEENVRALLKRRFDEKVKF